MTPTKPLTRTTFALAVSALLALTFACEQGGEGERCNPDLSHDECHSGLSCQQPPNCPENYCCPTTGSSDNPFCQAGCNGGLASICGADPTYDACAMGGDDASAALVDAAAPAVSDAHADGG